MNWYYTKGGVDTQIATTNITNSPAKTNDGKGRSVLIIPATAIGADAIKVVIQEFSASGDPISGQTISVADTSTGGGGTTTRPGPIAPGSNVTPGIYLSTDTLFTNNLLGSETISVRKQCLCVQTVGQRSRWSDRFNQCGPLQLALTRRQCD